MQHHISEALYSFCSGLTGWRRKNFAALRPISFRNFFLELSAFFALCAICTATWPIDFFEVRLAENHDSVLFSFRSPLGQSFSTKVIHSVQRTPVIDDYRVQQSRIWGWREHIMSHNAGLPSIRPERGRFLYASPWIIVEGGGASWTSIRYRIGTEDLGRNEFFVPHAPVRELWREFPGKAVVFSVSRIPLYATTRR